MEFSIIDISELNENLWHSFYSYYVNSLLHESDHILKESVFIERYKSTIDNTSINYEVIFESDVALGVIEKQYLNIGTLEEIIAIDITIPNFELFYNLEKHLYTYFIKLINLGFNIRIESKENKLIDLLKSLNSENTNQLIYYKLPFKNLKMSLLDSFLHKNVTQYSVYSTDSPTKDDLILSAELSTLLLNEMKRENDQQVFKETAENLINYVINCKRYKKGLFYIFIKDNGSLIGQTSIEISENGIEGNQMLTGVKKEYRRQGLSSLIKAKLYKGLRSKYPNLETIYTDCFAKNLPMIAANKKFGFKQDFIVSEMFHKNINK